MKLVQIKMLFAKVVSILKDCHAEVDLSPIDPILDRLIPIRENEDGNITIKLGKTNFVLKERFPDKGRTADEVLENLIVERCRQVS